MKKQETIAKAISLLTIMFLLNNTVILSQSMEDSLIVHTNFTIANDPADSYQGDYKNGKPYDGYFINGKDEFFWVDFYKKGELKYQYSRDFLEYYSGGVASETRLDIKSTYKNGKIIDGEAYTVLKDGVLIKKWKKGKLTDFSIDIFAMHYFNRLYFKKEDNALWVSNLKDTISKVKAYYKKGFLISELYHKDVLIALSENVDYTANSFPIKSEVIAYQSGTSIRAYANKIVNSSIKTPQNQNLNYEFFQNLDVSKSANIDLLFNTLHSSIDPEKGLESLFKTKENPLILAHFNADALGNIDNGIRWINTQISGSYYEVFKAGIRVEKENITLEAFQKIVKDYYKNR